MSINPNRISYRLATSEDQAFLDDMNVMAAARGRMPDAQLPSTKTFLKAYPTAAAFSEGFGRPSDMGLIAQDNDGVDIGVVWAREYDRTANDAMRPYPFEITIAVRDSVRGQGIGRQLLESFATMAWLRGKDEISLGVHPKNPGARHLYESVGYVPLTNAEGQEEVVEGGFTPMVRVLGPKRP